jgi:hypothetical protein
MARSVIPALGGSVIMVLAVMGLRVVLPAMEFTGAKFVVLGVLVASGVVVYMSALFLTQRSLLREIYGLLRARRSRPATETGT